VKNTKGRFWGRKMRSKQEIKARNKAISHHINQLHQPRQKIEKIEKIKNILF